MDGGRASTSDNSKLYLTFIAMGSLALLGLTNSYCSHNYRVDNSGSSTRVERHVERDSLGKSDLSENNYSRRSGSYEVDKR
ncbi:hypothetical protein J4423_02995 [Candidatus Pacearchaeota archaeon]|nr:hypothetical protein [Candidatus Pacearchaeota archaeon]